MLSTILLTTLLITLYHLDIHIAIVIKMVLPLELAELVPACSRRLFILIIIFLVVLSYLLKVFSSDKAFSKEGCNNIIKVLKRISYGNTKRDNTEMLSLNLFLYAR